MKNNIKIVAIIPARGGSKRLKRKNIYPVNGMPMIYYAIQACKKSNYKIDVWVSTEDEEISSVAKRFGAKVHNRNPLLAGDKVYKQEAIRSAARHIYKEYSPDLIISLQANSPTITPKQIDTAIEKLIEFNRDEIISVDENLMQNAAFRIFRGEYVFQQDLSTNCGVVISENHDVHTIEDVKIVERILNAR